MADAELVHYLNAVLWLVLVLSAPVLGVAAVVGLAVGLLQAVTQIQDQSLPQTIKLASILLTIILIGAALSGSLVQETRTVFDAFPGMARSGT